MVLTWLATKNLASFGYFETPCALVGHTHRPLVFSQSESGACSMDDFLPVGLLELGSERLIVNPGSVGQPRDGDPRASYAVYDSEHSVIRLHRVTYDVATTQSKMRRHGLPAFLVERLAKGV